MDFIIGLPKPEEKNVIMVVIDRITKYAHFCSLSDPFRTNTVVVTFMDTVSKLHGNSKIIVNDRVIILLEIF